MVAAQLLPGNKRSSVSQQILQMTIRLASSVQTQDVVNVLHEGIRTPVSYENQLTTGDNQMVERKRTKTDQQSEPWKDMFRRWKAKGGKAPPSTRDVCSVDGERMAKTAKRDILSCSYKCGNLFLHCRAVKGCSRDGKLYVTDPFRDFYSLELIQF